MQFITKVKMQRNYTAKYTKILSGYMGQLVEWPEIVTEGKTLEDCRESLKDAVNEMILAYTQMDKEIPDGSHLFEPLTIEIEHVRQAS